MSVIGLAWVAFGAVVLVLAARAVLTETVWRGHRDRPGPRWSVRGLDLLTAVASVTLVIALLEIVVRFVRFGR